MATKAAVLARFLLTICRQTTLHKACLVFAHNLSSDNTTQSLLGFCSQFVVRQRYARFLLTICRQTALCKVCPIFAANLSSGYMDTFACILPWICNDNMSSDFVLYLQAFCRHGLMYQNLYYISILFVNKICSKILQDLFLTDLAIWIVRFKRLLLI